MKTFVQILSSPRIHQFCDNPSIPRLVELINHDAVKPREFLYQAHDDLQKRGQIGSGSQLVCVCRSSQINAQPITKAPRSESIYTLNLTHQTENLYIAESIPVFKPHSASHPPRSMGITNLHCRGISPPFPRGPQHAQWSTRAHCALQQLLVCGLRVERLGRLRTVGCKAERKQAVILQFEFANEQTFVPRWQVYRTPQLDLNCIGPGNIERKDLGAIESRVRVVPYEFDVFGEVVGLLIRQDGQEIAPCKQFAGRVADDAFRILCGIGLENAISPRGMKIHASLTTRTSSIAPSSSSLIATRQPNPCTAPGIWIASSSQRCIFSTPATPVTIICPSSVMTCLCLSV